MLALARFWILGIVGAIILAGAAPQDALARSDIIGRWVPLEQDSIIDIYLCGDEVCGRIVKLDEPMDDSGEAKVDLNNRDEALRGRPILGMELLTGFSSKKAGSYRGGRIYNPRDGKLYKAILTLLDDGTLKIRGYVGVPALGQTQVWSRSAD
jgi:uncharacterized protein (DUF2147 family)